ncbi:glucosaminidase domain-containing protein [Candidatus Enterococcus ferrettii]|uniref:Mannosyl-glycoprotein endo-beta-N-acetylglucosamidase-like domain-containing protein n=1 Tax=Candidatus Enterococcus ferrettii TaxID=2815324 RepID=A0ABV0EMP8_9ENTE|nr:glucosaminidase domain-containing protein [Enterococcus sp. 665A]MBO1339025.1 glucosaminidase domain-containing protein [Enterococcus sp. 665A]
MKGKVLLVCVLIIGGLTAGYDSQVKQTVSAETRELISSQQETAPKIENSSTITSEASEEFTASTVANESFSSIEESKTSNTVASTSSSTIWSESEEQVEKPTTESTVSESKIPEAVPKVQTTLPAAKVEENYQFSVVKNQTTEEFIHSIGKDAQAIAWDEGLYASVMIAQAILETGSGNSQLARPPHHNLFGVKGSYQGKNVSFNTQEDKGNGQLYTIQSSFRQYPSYKESLEDYAALLKKGISGNAGFYQATWKEQAESYQVATKALTGKYATDTSYDKKLNILIETYELTIFDVKPSAEETSTVSETVRASSKGTEVFEEQTENEATESSTTEETKILTSETKQSAVFLPPVAQRPAKEVAGNRRAQ